MRNVAQTTCDATNVGSAGVMKPDNSDGGTLEGFQTVVAEAERMSHEGLIHIKEMHKESWSGNRYVTIISFVRLK
ncbi:MAG: hypothetical protein Q7K26_01500 [bacterium]|nr:hypothetical protein [bacterium]